MYRIPHMVYSPRTNRKSKSNKRKTGLGPDEVFEIARYANVNALGVLAGVNRSTRAHTKAEYDKRMPRTPLRHTKGQLMHKIWYIFSSIYGDDVATEWPWDIYKYFNIIGSFPEHSVNKAPYNAMYKFDSKRGYLEFMKRLSYEKVFGFYCWMNGRLFDYWRVNEWYGASVQAQKRTLQRMSTTLGRPQAIAIRNGL